MLSFAFPWIFLLWPLPLLMRWVLPPHREPRVGLRVPFMHRLEEVASTRASEGMAVAKRTRLQAILTWTVWTLLVLSLGKPQWVGEPLSKTLASRDLLLAVDLSGSMETADFTDPEGQLVERLDAVKLVLDDFLTKREGDRVGLVFFGNAAFVQTPFTEDIEVCRQLMDEAQVGMAGPKTMIGDAVGLAITIFQKSELEDRVLILLTDGNDSGSKVPPANAARLAADEGVTIHAVAVGDPQAAGEDALDEETLIAMAKATGGGYYRADDRDQLESIYERIDEVETRELQVVTHRPRSDLFHWPLGVAMGLVLLFHGVQVLLAVRRLRRVDELDNLPGKAGEPLPESA